MNLLNHDIYLIVGCARSGISLAKFLLDNNKKILLADLRKKEDLIEEDYGLSDILDRENITFIFQRQPTEDEIKTADIMIISPAVRPDSYPVITAKNLNIPVISEFEFADSFAKGYKIAITGTNGKTTTTTLIGELFKNAGYDTFIGGNIGDAYINSASMGDENSIYALEISSYQLEMLENFKPNISVITNITPDHLDRHGTFDEYVRIKSKVFENQDADDYLIINKDDKLLYKMVKKAKANVIYFTLKDDTKANAYLKDNTIIINFGGKTFPLIDISKLKLYGLHNVQNVMAAALTAIIKGIDLEIVANTLTSFIGVEHRIEFVTTIDGVDYINDSKATNSDAAITAIKAMTKPTVLLIGGYDKKTPFDELLKEIKESKNIKHIIIFGQTKDKIIKAAKDLGYAGYSAADTFESAIDKAAEKAENGDSVLLSPACASFDMFDDYEHRGKAFKEYIK